MKRLLLPCLLLLGLPLAAYAVDPVLTSTAITSDPVLSKFVQRYFGWHDLCADLHLEVERKSGSDREGTAKACVMLDKSIGYMRMTIESPHVMKGTIMLTHVSKDGQRKQWLYMLATKRAIPIENDQAEQPFMGTDFSYVDLSLNLLDADQLKPAGSASCDGKPCQAYDIRPNKGEYLRRIWLRKDNGALDRADIFDNGKQIKRLEVEDEVAVGKYFLPSKLEMKNLKSGGETTVEWSHAKLDQGLKPAYFDPDSLTHGASGRPP